MAPWTYSVNPTMLSLSEFREAARRGGWSSKSVYEYLKFGSEQYVPFFRLFKGPWRGPDGKMRNRVIVIFFPVVTWGLWTKPVEEVIRKQEWWVERILNPAFRPYKIRPRGQGRTERATATPVP